VTIRSSTNLRRINDAIALPIWLVSRVPLSGSGSRLEHAAHPPF
jgi:hypothetical protein